MLPHRVKGGNDSVKQQRHFINQFDLVCGDQWKQPFTTTVFYLGFLAGSSFSGQLSDRFGRKPVLFITMALQTIFTFSEMFSPSWTVFSILIFFNGLGHGTAMDHRIHSETAAVRLCLYFGGVTMWLSC